MPTAPPVLDPAALRRGFVRTAATYDAAAVLQREVARRMAERLEYIRLTPRRVLDLGCGTGADFAALARRYPQAQIVACDVAPAMLQQARQRTPWMRRALPPLSGRRAPWLVGADASGLPLRSGSIGMVWSNQMLHCCHDPMPALREVQRVLEVGGLFMFSTLGPDTLLELRRAFAADAVPHVHGFIDMHDLGDMLMTSGFAEPVMDMETITLTYDQLAGLIHDLKFTGSASALAERRRGLTGRGIWRRARDAYEQMRRDGRLPATFEVVYGHAWKAQATKTQDGRTIVQFDPTRRKGVRGAS